MRVIERTYVKSLLPRRAKAAHKGDFGRVLVVAGSPSMAGAPVLSARGAFRAGAGLVYVSAPYLLWPILQLRVPEVILSSRELDSLDLSLYDAVVAGPGLGADEETAALTEELLRRFTGPVVLDADALNVIAKGMASCAGSEAQMILTPHAAEAGRLLGIPAAEVDADREAAARALAEKYGAVAVLKGHETLVAQPGGAVCLNPTGNPGMAVAGSGDVLAGVIAAFAAQGMQAADAARAGVYLHGLAGDLAAEETGEYGLMALDIAEAVGRGILALTGR